MAGEEALAAALHEVEAEHDEEEAVAVRAKGPGAARAAAEAVITAGVDALALDSREDAANDDPGAKTTRAWRVVARGGKVVVPRSFAKHALSKAVMAEVIKQVVAQAVPLADRAFLGRMLDAGRAAKASGGRRRRRSTRRRSTRRRTRSSTGCGKSRGDRPFLGALVRRRFALPGLSPGHLLQPVPVMEHRHPDGDHSPFVGTCSSNGRHRCQGNAPHLRGLALTRWLTGSFGRDLLRPLIRFTVRRSKTPWCRPRSAALSTFWRIVYEKGRRGNRRP